MRSWYPARTSISYHLGMWGQIHSSISKSSSGLIACCNSPTQFFLLLQYTLHPPKQKNTHAGIALPYLLIVEDHLKCMQKLEFWVKSLVKNDHCKSLKKSYVWIKILITDFSVFIFRPYLQFILNRFVESRLNKNGPHTTPGPEVLCTWSQTVRWHILIQFQRCFLRGKHPKIRRDWKRFEKISN
jgi:hypothetical protein